MHVANITSTPNLACLGLNHRTAPVALREQLADMAAGWDDNRMHEVLPGLCEWVVLSTCNRLEFYGSFDIPTDQALVGLIRLLSASIGIADTELAKHLYQESGVGAAKHLCRVAAGLDSLVFGESQIQGQITEAFMCATQAKVVGPVLSAVFRSAIRVGKRARTETPISTNAASVSSIAINLAEQVVGDLHNRRILVIGLGEMGRLTLQALKVRNISHVAIANRTFDRAVSAASQPGWHPVPLEHLPDALAAADLVFTATRSAQPLITADMMRSIIDRRSHMDHKSHSFYANGRSGGVQRVAECPAIRGGRDMVLIDLAVPRDVDPLVGALPLVHLIDIDSLRTNLDAALDVRRRAVPAVEEIIEQELALLQQHVQELAMRPLVVDLRQKAEMIRQRELQRTVKYLGDLRSGTVRTYRASVPLPGE